MAENATAARPYAKAAFELAKNSGNFAGWSERLTFLDAIVSDSTVAAALDDPNRTATDRANLVAGIAGDRLDAEGSNMVSLLAENNRLPLLGDIGEIYEEMRAEEEGVLDANVTSAMALDDNYKQKLADALQRKFNKRINIIETVDDSLIGGAIIRAGDVVIDGSIKGRLAQLNSDLSTR